MPAPLIRGDFDKLQNIAKIFARNAQEMQKTTKQLKRTMGELESGGWVGQGANKFYKEMNSDIMPSMNRLARSMNSASRVTIRVLKTLKEVESIWMRIFRALGIGGGIGVGVGGAAGAGAGAGGGGGGVQAAIADWQQKSPYLVRDPNELFTDEYFDELINAEFKGTESPSRLDNIMEELLENPSEARTDELLEELADVRGRTVAEITVEWEKYKEIQEKSPPLDSEDGNPSLAGGAAHPHMGSVAQMRYGKVVGDALGIDPAFGAMLNPTGGMVGPGNVPLALNGDTAVSYHGVVHDAAGYLYNHQGKSGPGYDYLNTGHRGDDSSPLSGQVNGIGYWRNKVGSDFYSAGSHYVADKAIRGYDRASNLYDKIGSYF